MNNILAALIFAFPFLPFVFCQSPIYGQCGGIGWAGPSTCATGLSCTYQNDYYSQCLVSGTTISTPSSTASTAPASPSTTSGSGSVPHGETVLWFQQAAVSSTDAIVIGNGQLGASIWGNPSSDRFGLNQETMWAGGPYDPANPSAGEHLASIRQLVNLGEYDTAQSSLDQYSLGTPSSQAQFQSPGSLYLNFSVGSVSNYKRQLDVSQAVATTSFTSNGVTFYRTAFVSRPLNAMVLQLNATTANSLTFTAYLGSETNIISQTTTATQLILNGKNTAADNGVAGALTYQIRTRIILNGGSATTSGNSVKISGATSVILITGVATSFQKYNDVSGNPSTKLDTIFNNIPSSFSYATAIAQHIADYQSMFNRFTVDLGQVSSLSSLPTDQRIAKGMTPTDPGLISLFINFGRYLLICSSSMGSSQPANLQGIWQPNLDAVWESKFTVNINIEMNYWAAETAALGDTVEPLARLLEDIAITGRHTAQVMWGASSSAKSSTGALPYVLHHNTDQWRATAPIDGAVYGYWPTGAVWQLQTLWEHYQFDPSNTTFARRIYPLFAGASQFFLETLVPYVNNTDWLVTNPSMSPEKPHTGNTAIAPGPTLDNSLLRDLFSQTATLAALLGLDSGFAANVTNTAKRLPPFLIGSGGQIQEWLIDWDSKPATFSHISPMYGLYPGDQIDPLKNTTLTNAAKVFLGFRGDGNGMYGWPIAWRVGTWARLMDGAHSMTEIKLLLSSTGVWPSLLGKNEVFQIDANLGGAGAMLEMFVQSHNGIHLLPALPSDLPQGTITGLRARGGYTVGLTWSGGVLTQAVITATIAQARSTTVRLAGGTKTVPLTLAMGASRTFTTSDF